MKSHSDDRPLILQNLGDGSWYYNFNIKETETPAMQEGEEEKTAFEYETVHIWGKPTYESLVPLIVAEQYSPSEETGLINKFNAYTMKLSLDAQDKERYEDYLKKTAEIKAMVKTDLRELGILEPEPARTLNQAIAEKIVEIDEYDTSDEVNSFLVNNQKTWIDAGTRAVFRNSIDSAELLQEETIQMPIAGTILTIPVGQAKIMLAKIQRYADNAAIVTIQHKTSVSNLKTISKVDNYNFRNGYPAKEEFNMTA